jgi:uncharacterized damage-inducible protein DinB
MPKPIVEIYKHNLWANLLLLDACAPLDAAGLQKRVAGTYGSIAETLVHVLAAEERYVTQISALGAPRAPLHESKPFPAMAMLRTRAERSGKALIDFAEHARPAQTLRGNYGRPYVMSAAAPLVQGVNHATEHRTQIATAVSQLGVEPPQLDGWAYATASGLLRWTDPG